MSEHLKRLVEEQNKLWNRMQEIQRGAESESRDWTAEERQNWDEANTRIDVVSGDIERLERAQHLDSIDWSRAGQAGQVAQTPEDTPEERAAQRERDYERAFGAFMRGGLERLSNEHRALMLDHAAENRAGDGLQSTAPGNIGGFLIPPGYRAVITEAMKAYGGMINLANVITTSTGNNLQWPSNDDTGNIGAILDEHTAVPTQELTFGTKSIGAFLYTSKLVLVSLQLLQDSAFNLDAYLPNKLGERIGRAVAQHLISGTGTGQPEGIATNATASVTGAVGFGITYDNMIDLEHSLDPAYRNGGTCRFVFNDTTLSVLRKITDTALGRPLWLPVPTPGFPATINGVPYVIDQNMPSPGANAKSILFGDFKRAYIVRQVLDTQMVRLAERFMDKLEVGFFGYMRLDAKPDDALAVRAFQHDAT